MPKYEITGDLYGPTERGEKQVRYSLEAETRDEAKRELRKVEIFPSVLPFRNGGQVSVDFRTLREVRYA